MQQGQGRVAAERGGGAAPAGAVRAVQEQQGALGAGAQPTRELPQLVAAVGVQDQVVQRGGRVGDGEHPGQALVDAVVTEEVARDPGVDAQRAGRPERQQTVLQQRCGRGEQGQSVLGALQFGVDDAQRQVGGRRGRRRVVEEVAEQPAVARLEVAEQAEQQHVLFSAVEAETPCQHGESERDGALGGALVQLGQRGRRRVEVGAGRRREGVDEGERLGEVAVDLALGDAGQPPLGGRFVGSQLVAEDLDARADQQVGAVQFGGQLRRAVDVARAVQVVRHDAPIRYRTVRPPSHGTASSGRS